MINKLQDFANATAEWSDATFGTNRSPVPILHHLGKEIPELIEAIEENHKYKDTSIKEVVKHDLHMEFADVFTLIVDAARCTGIDTHTLLKLGLAEYDRDPNIEELQDYMDSFPDTPIPGKVLVSLLKDRTPELISLIETFEKDNSEDSGVTMLRGFGITFATALYAAKQEGLTAQELTENCWTKLEINKKRKWGAPDANGVVEHTEE